MLTLNTDFLTYSIYNEHFFLAIWLNVKLVCCDVAEKNKINRLLEDFTHIDFFQCKILHVINYVRRMSSKTSSLTLLTNSYRRLFPSLALVKCLEPN
jgi:hypothetical protein